MKHAVVGSPIPSMLAFLSLVVRDGGISCGIGSPCISTPISKSGRAALMVAIRLMVATAKVRPSNVMEGGIPILLTIPPTGYQDKGDALGLRQLFLYLVLAFVFRQSVVRI